MAGTTPLNRKRRGAIYGGAKWHFSSSNAQWPRLDRFAPRCGRSPDRRESRLRGGSSRERAGACFSPGSDWRRAARGTRRLVLRVELPCASLPRAWPVRRGGRLLARPLNSAPGHSLPSRPLGGTPAFAAKPKCTPGARATAVHPVPVASLFASADDGWEVSQSDSRSSESWRQNKRRYLASYSALV